jgi:flagellar biosynthesis protein FlhG
VKDRPEAGKKPIPKIWAIGGGKGGVGKSVVCTLLGFWLARMGKRTVLVDTDLGGANLHTLLGIRNSPRTLNDFVSRKFDSLEEICLESEEQNLRLISGASEVLSLANPQFAQKVKIIQNVFKLDADYVILDLGGGASFNVLDFFLVSHQKITVLSPQPTAIQNTYGFVRNAVYRRLTQIARKEPSLQTLVKTAMNPKNELKVRTVKELLQVVRDSESEEVMERIRKEMEKIRPAIITNMAKDSRDKNAGRIIQLVSEKYLMIQPVDVGSVMYDKQVEKMISNMVPLTDLDQSSEAVACVYEIASRLV